MPDWLETLFDIERAVGDLQEKDLAIQLMAIETLDGRLTYVNKAFVRDWA